MTVLQLHPDEEPETVACTTCGAAFAGDDPEDAGLTRCADTVWWDERWHCPDCAAECLTFGACQADAVIEAGRWR